MCVFFFPLSSSSRRGAAAALAAAAEGGGKRKREKKKTTYSLSNGLQGIEPGEMCQDGEVSISRFSEDLCSSWKPAESMTARRIKLPRPPVAEETSELAAAASAVS